MGRGRGALHRPLLLLTLSWASAFDLSVPVAAFCISPPSSIRRGVAASSAALVTIQSCQADPATHTTMSTSQKKPKIELFFKTESELRERVRFLASRGYTSYSLVNKNKEDKTINWCKAAIEEVQGATVTVHYSLKYNKPGGRQTPDEAQAASYTRFTKHLEKMDSMAFGSGAETLLISGSNPKTPLDSVTCLERLRKDINSSALAEEQCKSIGVAYNPYIPADDLASEERGRVEKKLKTGAVSSVWLQFGDDAKRLESGLEWLKSLEGIAPKRIVGSLFLPTAKLIAQQKFRPWNGVHLSEEYLSGIKGAERSTMRLLEVYRKFEVEVLVEAPGVRTEKDLDVLEAILEGRPVGAAAGGGGEGDGKPALKKARPAAMARPPKKEAAAAKE